MDQVDSFTLNADQDFYERTVSENDLVLSFDPNSDGESFVYFEIRFNR